MPLSELEKLFMPKEMEFLNDPAKFESSYNKNIVKTTKYRAKKQYLEIIRELLEIAKKNSYMFNGNNKERIKIIELIRNFLGERVRIINQPLSQSTKRKIIKLFDKVLDDIVIQTVKKGYEED